MTKLAVTSKVLQNAELKSAAGVESRQMNAVKGEYHAHMLAKRELRAKVMALAAQPKNAANVQLLEETKTQLGEVQKKAAGLKAKFQSLYYITFGASHLSYMNNPDHPGDPLSILSCASAPLLPTRFLGCVPCYCSTTADTFTNNQQVSGKRMTAVPERSTVS